MYLGFLLSAILSVFAYLLLLQKNCSNTSAIQSVRVVGVLIAILRGVLSDLRLLCVIAIPQGRTIAIAYKH